MSDDRFIIGRTGTTPLVFRGNKIAGAGGPMANKSKRWHEVDLYRTSGGRYVLEIRYVTVRPNEPSHSWADVVEGRDGVLTRLAQHDPLSCFIGWPNLDRYAHQQSIARAEVEAQWAHTVSALTTELPDLFGEEVE